MSYFTNRYYPTVALRRGEMKAFEKLPSSEKEKMLPIVLLAPWLNSIKFENSFNIIAKSIGDQKIIVDLDRHYRSSSPLESRSYFWSLLSATKGPKEWMKLIEDHENYIPCIITNNIDKSLIDQQIEWAKSLGRGFCFRFEVQNRKLSQQELDIVGSSAGSDFLTVIDLGYGDFSESRKEDISDDLSKIYDLSTDNRVVIACSNFPNDFAEFDDFSKSQPIAARQLFGRLQEQYGNYRLFYGDWASAKPRTYDGHGSPPLPRIDFPTPTSWIMARSKEQRWSLEDAATRITRLPDWANHPKVWGTGMIEKTARGLPGGIKTHPDVIAARINIHLFVQANFGIPDPPLQPKGKWQDPL